MRHWLFAVDVLAGGAGVQHHASMLVVRNSYNHGIYIFAVEDFSVAAGRRDCLLHSLLSRLMPAVVEIAYRNAFNARHGQRGCQQFASAGARSYRSESHAITGCHGAARGPQCFRFKEGEFYPGSGGHRTGADPHKIATRQRMHSVPFSVVSLFARRVRLATTQVNIVAEVGERDLVIPWNVKAKPTEA